MSLWAQQVKRRRPHRQAKRRRLATFPPWVWTADRNKIGGLQRREDFTSQHTHKYTHPKNRVRLRPPTSTQVSGESHLMSHQTKELAEEMEGNMLCLHFQWQLFLLCALIPGGRKLYWPNYNLLSLLHLWSQFHLMLLIHQWEFMGHYFISPTFLCNNLHGDTDTSNQYFVNNTEQVCCTAAFLMLTCGVIKYLLLWSMRTL